MRLGFVGLGRMGSNMTRRLVEGGHEVTAFDHNATAVASAQQHGVRIAESLDRLAAGLAAPRVVWSMVPAGAPTEETIALLHGSLEPGDVIVDGGNSNYRDTIRRSEECAQDGVTLIDAGTSGGIWGYEAGFCLMVGADPAAFALVEPALRTLAPEGGYARVGPAGAGHFAKMVHNGIEYGMLQAYGEGFDLLHASEFGFDLHAVAGLWGRGSVVRSWLLELLEGALAGDPALDGVKGYVEDSGEGRWALAESIARDVPAPVLALSLFARFDSRRQEAFSAKVIAALRREFGGHAVRGD